jgi:hypothetical protein
VIARSAGPTWARPIGPNAQPTEAR